MAAILAKVFSLALRTISKPLGSQMQRFALQHPGFRQNAISIAQILHRTEVYITRGAAGKKGKAIVGQMSDERALELAATFVSEGFVFSVGVGIVVWEYNRNKNSEALKKKQEEERVKRIQEMAMEERRFLQRVNDEQNERLESLRLRLDNLEKKFERLKK